MTEKPEVGYEIIVYGLLMHHNNSVAEIVDGWIVDDKANDLTSEQPEIELVPGQKITIAKEKSSDILTARYCRSIISK